MTAAGLLEPTPGASLPSNSTGGEWVAFADRQTGQLDKSNADKAGAQRLYRTCEQLHREALEKARRKRFLGIF